MVIGTENPNLLHNMTMLYVTSGHMQLKGPKTNDFLRGSFHWTNILISFWGVQSGGWAIP